MNEQLLKHFLNMKISLVRKGVEQLPESLQKPVKELETQIMRVLYEISKENVEKATGGEDTKQATGFKSIDVD
jgi:hypothetical protein